MDKLLPCQTKYILVFPFKTRAEAFEVANDIYGSLVWGRGKAYPIDGVPAEIFPIEAWNTRYVSEEMRELAKEVMKTYHDYIDVADLYSRDAVARADFLNASSKLAKLILSED